MQYDDPFAQNRHPFPRSLLEDERRRVSSGAEQRKDDLRLLIEIRGSELADDNELSKLFGGHLDSLSPPERPQTIPQEHRLYNQWEIGLKQELAQWQDELAVLKSQPIDGQQVFNNAKDRILQLLEAEARESGLLPRMSHEEKPLTLPAESSAVSDSPESGGWMTFPQLREWGRNLMRQEKKGTSIKPLQMRDSKGTEIPVRNWANLLSETAEWLIREGLLTENDCPVSVVGERSRYLIHEMPIHEDQRRFKNIKKLSNGLNLELQLSSGMIAQRCAPLVEHFGQDPAQFHVWLG